MVNRRYSRAKARATKKRKASSKKKEPLTREAHSAKKTQPKRRHKPHVAKSTKDKRSAPKRPSKAPKKISKKELREKRAVARAKEQRRLDRVRRARDKVRAKKSTKRAAKKVVSRVERVRKKEALERETKKARAQEKLRALEMASEKALEEARQAKLEAAREKSRKAHERSLRARARAKEAAEKAKQQASQTPVRETLWDKAHRLRELARRAGELPPVPPERRRVSSNKLVGLQRYLIVGMPMTEDLVERIMYRVERACLALEKRGQKKALNIWFAAFAMSGISDHLIGSGQRVVDLDDDDELEYQAQAYDSAGVWSSRIGLLQKLRSELEKLTVTLRSVVFLEWVRIMFVKRRSKR